MAMDVMCVLPQELVDHIIDSIGDDQETLQACAVVRQSWTSASQRSLFRHVRLTNRNLLVLFQQVISSSLRLANFTKHLEVVDTATRRSQQWIISSSNQLSVLLPLLSNLNSIIFDFNTMPWREVARMEDVLRQAFRMPNLVHATLDGIRETFTSVWALTLFEGSLVKAISLRNIYVSRESPNRSPDSPKIRLPSVESLSLVCLGSLHVLDSLREITFSALRELSVLVESWDEVLAVSKIAGNLSLDTLALHWDTQSFRADGDLTPTLNPIQLGRLPHIHFQPFPLSSKSYGMYAPLEVPLWWATYFRQVSDSFLRTITVTFHKKSGVSEHDHDQCLLEMSSWNQLDAALSPTLRLRDVILSDEYLQSDGCEDEGIRGRVRQAFPLLYERGILRF
ncbi:uncharacterized protein BT62DRAFT_920013 [Guyanagaster necrorhizus]|uniref:F-box domain-containing protein n=1 Tax=Guyanagaster necrorhizus TaxID=856835 RepID=A0A9P7VSU0_9AGAR|nr:uncharacterized protein BT62DRAFT_920013 [Guyanagaster necrorhizus MCA 3950]KAG7445932.1 hypothetical protein BT62DRAFT_920013 [Guyanagaster necrorhizus MCA 3950]